MRKRTRPRTKASEQVQESSTRPFWSGTITFGFVSIPVNLFPASQSTHAGLRMLGPDGAPLSRRYVSQESGKQLADEQMVRGYEIAKNKYVTVTDEELERLEPEKSRDIDLRLFVKNDAIPPIYVEHTYFLAPAGGSLKAYQLLAETMETSGRAGIATFVMRGKEYLVAILSENGILRAETLRFSDELRAPESIGLPKTGKVSQTTVRRLDRLIQKHSGKRITPQDFHDETTERLMKLVDRKTARHQDVIDAEVAEKRPAKVVDLMEVLKKSLTQKRAA